MRSRILFMATTKDLRALMTEFETQKPVMYTLTGFPDKPLLHQSFFFAEINDFGIPKFGNMGLEDSFLLSDSKLEIKVEPVPQNKGGVKYRIYTELNPRTLLLRPGGLFQGNTVISSELMKYSDEPEAKEMFAVFQRTVKRQFTKHDTYPYWLGKEASQMLETGFRLTNDINSSFSLPLIKPA